MHRRRGLISRMQRLEELDEGGGFGRTQILSVSGHVAAALKNLADQLILREACRDEIESRATLSAHACNRMTVAALLRLKNDGPLPLEWARIMGIADWNRWSAAPCAHLRAPRREGAKMRAHTPPNCDCGQHQDRDRASVPTLLTFARIKRK